MNEIKNFFEAVWTIAAYIGILWLLGFLFKVAEDVLTNKKGGKNGQRV